MRSLQKGPIPKTIAEKGALLTADYMAAPSDSKTSPWKATDVVAALKDETHSKCAYCESEVAAVAWEHVEHIKPKKFYPHLVIAWENLTLACPKCNIFKGENDPADQPISNPYEPDIEKHFIYAGSLLLARPGDAMAKNTITLLRLYRSELEEKRRAAIRSLDSLLHDWARANSSIKDAIAEMIVDAAEDDQEYASFLRAFLVAAEFPIFQLLGARRSVA